VQKQSPLALVAILVVALLAGLTGGYVWYWNQLADSMGDGLKIWLGQRRAEGLVAENGRLETSGFPFAVQLDIASLELGRGDKGQQGYWAWSARDISASLSPLKPWRINATTTAPQNAHFTDAAGAPRNLTMAARKSKAVVDIANDGRLAAVDLRFEAMALTGSALKGPVLAGRLNAHADLLQETKIDIQGDSILLPKKLKPAFGEFVEVVRLAATVTGPLPKSWSRGPVTAWRDDGGTVDLTRGRVKWGKLDVTGSGTFALDSRMRPQGSGTANMRGHADSIKGLVERNLITPLNGAALTLGLNMLGQQSDGSIKLPFSAQNGKMKFGAISALVLKPFRFPDD
jgi:hypothetical protein